MAENLLIDSLLRLEKKKTSKSNSGSKVNRGKRRKNSQKSSKLKYEELLHDNERYNEFKTKADEFERLISRINGEEIMNANILKILINIQKTLAEKIFILVNDSNIKVNESSVNDETASKSNLNFDKKLLSTSKTSIHSEMSNSLSLKDLKDNDEYNDFLNRTSCPFCSKVVKNKIYLIKHLDENCDKKKVSVKSDHVPYSDFQILPNNLIKCNICRNSVFNDLAHYFIHLISRQHKNNSKIASCAKLHTDDLFCSACKILIPNNFTELKFHMEHLFHKQQISDEALIATNSKNKFTCLLMKNKNLKCLACSLPYSNKKNFEEYYDHINNKQHLKNLKILDIDYDRVYCEVCRVAIGLSDLSCHLKSVEHEKRNEKFCLCLYCGDVLFGLKKLEEHMTSECSEIKHLKTNEPLLKDKRSIFEGNFTETRNIEEIAVPQKHQYEKSKRHLLVKGQENIRQVFLFFKKYGEVATINKLDKTTLIVEFYDSEIVQKIMKLKNPIIIDGVNIEVTDDFDAELYLRKPFTENEDSEESNNDDSDNEENSSSDNNENIDVTNNFYKFVDEIIPLTFRDKKGKVDFECIIQDCIRNLGCKSCSVIGFQSCELCDPEDELSLFCDLQEGFFLKFFTTETDCNFSLISKTSEKMRDSKWIWEDVNLQNEPLPFITCRHKETKKKCNIFFSEYVKILSLMFSKIMDGRGNVRYFFLIIKYWLQFNHKEMKEFELVIISLGLFFLSSHFKISLGMKPDEIHLKIANLVMKDNPEIENTDLNSESLTSMNVKDLVLRFLNFLLRFDFNKYAICLPLNYPVSKLVLTQFISTFKNNDFFSIYIFDSASKCNIASHLEKDEFKSLFIKLVQKLSSLMQ